MNNRTLQDLDRRLRQLERSAVRLRKGEMTSDGLVLGSAACDTSAAISDLSMVGDMPDNGDTTLALTDGSGRAVGIGPVDKPRGPGPQGPQGPSGPTGPQGPAGPEGPAKIPNVATLPASPDEGTLVAHKTWVLRYTAAAPDGRFPWEVLFGATKAAETIASGSVSTGAFANLTGGGSFEASLSVSMPDGLRGIVDIAQSCTALVYGDGDLQMSYKIGSTSASTDWCLHLAGHALAAGESHVVSGSRVTRHTITTAGVTVLEQGRRLVNVTSVPSQRRLALHPIWVGPAA